MTLKSITTRVLLAARQRTASSRDIAAAIGEDAATVRQAISRLRRDGLIATAAVKGDDVRLTPSGERVAGVKALEVDRKATTLRRRAVALEGLTAPFTGNE